MGNKFLKVKDKQALDELVKNSESKPVVIFKHSNARGISASIFKEMEQLGDQVNLVEVQSARDISRELANMTGIRHETPQVIVLRDGKAVWNASHFGIKAAEVKKAVESHS